jgi:hypothetical protein
MLRWRCSATMANWNTLAADLAEPSRKRVPQVPAFFARQVS